MNPRLEGRPEKLPASVAAEIARLDKILFNEDAAVELKGTWWWIIRDTKGVGIAFAGMRPCRASCNSGLAYMVRSGVRRNYRGKGLQKKLINARVAMARRQGFKEVVTYTLDWNLASANSLIGCGFKLYTPGEYYAGKKAFYFRKPL